MSKQKRILKVACLAMVTVLVCMVLGVTTIQLLDTSFGNSISRNSTTMADLPSDLALGKPGMFISIWWQYDLHGSSEDMPVYEGNSSSGNRSAHNVSPYFVVTGQTLTATAIFGTGMVIILVFFPGAFTPEDRKYPKMQMIIPGCAQGLSTILVIYAMSGTRTPPYLQAIIGNFNIPIQFIIRFIIIHKRPTLFKLCCAIAVLVAEFVCLIPTIFPELENAKQHHNEGGAKGVGRVLYPMLMVLSMVPFAIGNSVLEKGVQKSWTKESSDNKASLQSHEEHSSLPNARQVNMCYYMFWLSVSCSTTLLLFFWVDIIPGYGTSENMKEFINKMKLDWLCAVGQAGCSPGTVTLLWATFILLAIRTILFAVLIRHSEGANFVVIAMSLRTPLQFLFWTLFTENPFGWSPHVALSTWLSLGGLVIMLPAVILYNVGAPEVVHTRTEKEDADQKYLIPNEESLEDHNIRDNGQDGLVN